MTTDQIDVLIQKSKVIPLSFVWEDGNEYYFEINTLNSITNAGNFTSFSPRQYPNWAETNQLEYGISFWPDIISKAIYDQDGESFEKCLSDFLFWFEINKNRFKEITYFV